jgi:hypothetical protein
MEQNLNLTLKEILDGASGILTPIAMDRRVTNGPVMQGKITKSHKAGEDWKEDFALPIVAFLKTASGNEKQQYLSVSAANGLFNFVLFPNKDKKNDKHPDASGNVAGKESGMLVSAYNVIKDGVNTGNKRLSFYIAKPSGSSSSEPSDYQPYGNAETDMDIPF